MEYQAFYQQYGKNELLLSEEQNIGSSGTTEYQNYNSGRETSSNTHTRLYKCTICNKQVTWLKRHMQTHTGIKDFKCTICQKEFIEKSNLLRHIKVHTGEKNFSCSLCNMKFLLKAHLGRHMKIHIGVDDISESIDQTTVQEGNKIQESTDGNDMLDEFATSEVNKEHKLYQEKDGESSATGTTKFQNQNSEKEVEFYTHTDRCKCAVCNRHICAICSKQLLTIESLKRHMKIHSGTSYRCSVCSKEFSKLSILRVHFNTHNSMRIRKYECKICSKRFLEKWHLKTHVKIHTEDKKFKCLICSEVFIRKLALNSHMKYHIGFQCIINPQENIDQMTSHEESDLLIKIKNKQQKDTEDSLLEKQDTEKHLKERDIDIKEEFDACEDNTDQVFYQQVIKCELSSISSDV